MVRLLHPGFLMSLSTIKQGYSTAFPVLEYPPRRVLRKLKTTDGPDMNNVVPSLLAAEPEPQLEMPERILQSMRSDTNRFTTKPHSQEYKSVLEKRLQLPVYAQLPKFCRLFSKRQVLIVTGGTGTGKTTQIPQFVAYCDIPQLKGKMIAVTQPRRVTTVSVASRVAAEMDVELGREVGYSIRFDDKTTPGVTFLRYMTDGTLLHEAMSDPEFSKYSTIIIDEAHERTVNTDMLMALLKSVAKKRPNLKIIIMSATLDAPTFQRYFSLDAGTTTAPLLRIQGQSYPVEILHIKQSVEDYVQTAIQVVMCIHATSDPGDILLFLTGEDEIETARKKLTELMRSAVRRNPKIGPLDCIPLYSLLGPEKQKRIFDSAPKPRFKGSHPGRKVIISTNIAETSLTIDGICYVVDCGYSKQKVFIPRSKISHLRPMKISKASAQQRVGRAGRTGPGKCYRLYTEDEFHDMVAKTRPEVLNVDLSEAVLKLLKIGVKSEELLKFDFIDSPTDERVACAFETLHQLGATDKEKDITALGRMMAEFPLNPRLSKALIESIDLKSYEELVTIAAMLSVQSVWRRPYGEQHKADQAKMGLSMAGGDHLTLLNVYNKYIENSCDTGWAAKNYLSIHALEEAKKVREQLYEMLDVRYQVKSATEEKEPPILANVQKALATGYYMQIAVRARDGTYVRLKETKNHPFRLHPSCVLKLGNAAPKWIMYDELMRNRDLVVRTVTEVSPKMLLQIAPDYFDPESFSDEFVKEELMAAIGTD